MAKTKASMNQIALTEAIKIQNELRALNNALSDVEKGMANGDLRRQVADQCATQKELVKRMEYLIQMITGAKHDADETERG